MGKPSLAGRSKFKQGKFTPRYPGKYRGDVNNIIFRSSWEKYCFEFLDGNRNILKWGSEVIAIPYIKPEHQDTPRPKVSRYFPDIWVQRINPNGEVVEEVIEIKPSSQAQPSTRKTSKVRMRENAVYNLNKAKWIAAHKWCKQRGLKFRVLTERSLFDLKQ